MKQALSFFAIYLVAMLCCAADEPASIQATSSTPIYPLLIRNEHGPLTRVIVDVGDATGQLESWP